MLLGGGLLPAVPWAEWRRCVPYPRGGSGTLRPRQPTQGTAGVSSVRYQVPEGFPGAHGMPCVWDTVYLCMFLYNKELLVQVSGSQIEFRCGLRGVGCPACCEHSQSPADKGDPRW